MRFARSIHWQIADFGAENMGKDMNPGVKSVKQWGGAHFTDRLSSVLQLTLIPTGGVPRLLPTQCVYQLQSNSVANKALQKCR